MEEKIIYAYKCCDCGDVTGIINPVLHAAGSIVQACVKCGSVHVERIIKEKLLIVGFNEMPEHFNNCGCGASKYYFAASCYKCAKDKNTCEYCGKPLTIDDKDYHNSCKSCWDNKALHKWLSQFPGIGD